MSVYDQLPNDAKEIVRKINYIYGKPEYKWAKNVLLGIRRSILKEKRVDLAMTGAVHKIFYAGLKGNKHDLRFMR